MDMKIAGKGNIPAGEYNKVTSRGKGHFYGRVKCSSFKSSGTCKGEIIECAGKFKASGRAVFSEDIKAKSIRVSGSLSCEGDITAEDSISFHGGAKCRKSIKCESLSAFGSLCVFGDIEAEKIKTAGVLNCEGLINAESIQIKADKPMNIGSIGGSNIVVKRKLISIFRKRCVTVATSIEGDNISLEYVTCPRVTGRTVVIGKGCRIDLVQYSEGIELKFNKDHLTKTEKI